jgi:hypothetical protein
MPDEITILLGDSRASPSYMRQVPMVLCRIRTVLKRLSLCFKLVKYCPPSPFGPSVEVPKPQIKPPTSQGLFLRVQVFKGMDERSSLRGLLPAKISKPLARRRIAPRIDEGSQTPECGASERASAGVSRLKPAASALSLPTLSPEHHTTTRGGLRHASLVCHAS